MDKVRQNSSRTLYIFYFLVGYVLLQFTWWAYHLISLNSALHNESSVVYRKVIMILGEAGVFLIILLAGIFLIKRSFKKEIELQREKQNFILSVTHELKTPIASSKLFVETLLKRELPIEKQKEILNKVNKDQNRLQKLVDNILFVSRLDQHEVKPNLESVNLKEYTLKITQRIQYAENAHIELDIPEKTTIRIDPFLFTSVIQNLTENAIKYSSEKPRIKWKYSKNNDKSYLLIEDNGIGIPQKERKKVFELFHRVGDENTRATKGTGLGLYLVKKIVTLHDFSIKIKDKAPNGTIFEIELAKQ